MKMPRSLFAIGLWGLLGPSLVVAATVADRESLGPVVELPPLEVSAGINNAPPWKYAESEGVEVLTRCSNAVTRDFVQAHYRLEQMFAFLVPREFLVKLAVPKIIVLADKKSTPTASQDLVQGFVAPEKNEKKEEPPPSRRGEPRTKTEGVQFLANLRLNDIDAVAVYAILDEFNFNSDTLALTPSHMRFMLERRAPPLPAWLIEGFMGLTGELSFQRHIMILGPTDWTSDAEEENLKKDPDYPRTLLPMRELLENPRPTDPDGKSDTARRWRAQASLFVRWAIDGTEASRRAAFWRFVARACAGPVNEAVFRECFAMGYSDARDRLSDYLPGALKNSVRLDPGKIPSVPEPKLRLATDAEIGRIKGEWERLEINFVKALHPQYIARYEEQANRTLTKAYSKVTQDVHLNTIIALRACDAGDDAKARPLLEEAFEAKVVRPRAYYELARLRYTEAAAQPAGRNGLLDSTQANHVLAPLSAARTQMPPLAQTYALAAEVWGRSDVQLGDSQLALLDEGLRLFPKHIGLVYFVCVVKFAQGREADAAALIERGLRLNPPAPLKLRFEKMQAALAARRAPLVKP